MAAKQRLLEKNDQPWNAEVELKLDRPARMDELNERIHSRLIDRPFAVDVTVKLPAHQLELSRPRPSPVKLPSAA